MSAKKLGWSVAACMGVTVFGLALIWVGRQGLTRPQPVAGAESPPEVLAPASMGLVSPTAEPPLRLSYTVTIPAQQVGLFELVQKQGERWETVPGFSAYAMAPLAAPRQVEYQLIRDASNASCTVRVQAGASEVMATGLRWPEAWQHLAGTYADGLDLESGGMIIRALPEGEVGEAALAVRFRSTPAGWSANGEDTGRGLGLGIGGAAGEGTAPAVLR